MRRRVIDKGTSQEILANTNTNVLLSELKQRGQIIFAPIKHQGLADFVLVTQTSLAELAQMRMGGNSWRVLLFMLSVCDFENWVFIKHSDVAERMGLSPSAFSALLKELLVKGVIQRQTKGSCSFHYRINPDVAWRGSITNLKKLLKEIQRRESSKCSESMLSS